MNETIRPLSVRDFINRYGQDEDIFSLLPEFSFIKPIAAKAKEKNCLCGLGAEINRAIMMYNDFVNTLDPDLTNKVKLVFALDKACFAIQTADTFEVKCYD